MFYLKDTFIMSDTVHDGMDSARAHGILWAFSKDHSQLVNKFAMPGLFMNYDGRCFRHPTDIPANNPKNFTRDQLICLAAGLRFAHKSDFSALFWSHAKRLFFCQNFERDYVGTKKYPWPHKMTGGDPADEGKWKMFDFADPLLPHHIAHLIRCCQIDWLYWLLPIGNIFLYLSCVFNSSRVDVEQNQLQCMVKVAGPYWMDLYKRYNNEWIHQTVRYWASERNCKEMADIIIEGMK